MRNTTIIFALLVLALFGAAVYEWWERPLVRDSVTTQPVGYVIDLNTADAATIAVLPEIGPKLAETIVAYRAEHGPFTSVEAVDDVKGVGPRRLAAIRPYVKCGAATQPAM